MTTYVYTLSFCAIPSCELHNNIIGVFTHLNLLKKYLLNKHHSNEEHNDENNIDEKDEELINELIDTLSNIRTETKISVGGVEYGFGYIVSKQRLIANDIDLDEEYGSDEEEDDSSDDSSDDNSSDNSSDDSSDDENDIDDNDEINV